MPIEPQARLELRRNAEPARGERTIGIQSENSITDEIAELVIGEDGDEDEVGDKQVASRPPCADSPDQVSTQ